MRPGELIPLAGPVSLLAGENQGRFPLSHSLVIEGRRTVLIDTGCGLEVLRPWAQAGRVELVLNTHTHPDHSAGNHLFAGREILVPEQARSTAGSARALSERLTEPGELAAIWRGFVARDMGFKDQPPTGFFSPGQEIDAGGVRLVAVHTPGHTSDHFCFHAPELGLVITADIDLTPFGPWYGHRESNLAQVRASILAVKALEPRLLVSSHRPPLGQGIGPALDAYLGVIDRREEKILDLLQRERTREDILDHSPIYGGHPRIPELLRYWEGQMIDKHLQELLTRGLARRTEGDSSPTSKCLSSEGRVR